MTFDAPIQTDLREIPQEWIDYNGHLNMAYYNVLFDSAADTAFEKLGCGQEYLKTYNHSFYTAEAHVKYKQELHSGHKVTASFQLIEYDKKRLRVYQELHHEDGWLAATCELLMLHIDMNGPRVAEMPSDVMEKVIQMHKAHSNLTIPQAVGQGIALKRQSN